MDKQHFVDRLNTLPMKSVLIPLAKRMHGGTFGFDYLKDDRTKTRPALCEYLTCRFFNSDSPTDGHYMGKKLVQTLKEMRNISLFPKGLFPTTPASSTPAPSPLPQQSPTTPSNNKAGESRPVPPTDSVSKLGEALAHFLPETVTTNDVQNMIDAALSKVEKETVYIAQAPDGKTIKTEGARHKNFDRALKCAQLRQNLLLVGPAGSGKTTLAGQIAEALGLRFGYISLSGGISENNLTGWLLPIESGGKFSYVPAQFVDFVENGGLYLLDDIGCAAPDVLAVLNAGLANRKMFLPQRHGQEELNFHKDFTCVGATNQTHGDVNYSAQERMSAEMLDRFCASTIKIDYDPNLEKKLVDPDVFLWAQEIRIIIKRNKLERIMSTRAMLEFSKQANAYKWDSKQWDESYFSTWTPEELDKVKAYRKGAPA